MATRTITHLYDTYDEATRAVDALEAAGVPHSDISLVGSNGGAQVAQPGTATPLGQPTTTPAEATSGSADASERSASTGAGAGASLGTIVGGGAGLLAGIGALAIPGVGPVVAAGWLIATLTGAGAGAAAGGLLGALTGSGVAEKDAHVYAEGVRRGGTLLTVRTDDASASRIEEILGGTQAVNIDQRGTDYRAGGWNAFDPATPGYTPATLDADRNRSPLA